MRKRPLLSSFFLVVAMANTMAFAQAGPSGQVKITAKLPAGVDPSDVQTTLVLDGAVKVTCSILSRSSDNSMTFTCDAEIGAHAALVEVKASGYKLYSINMAGLNVTSDRPAEINLGQIHLTDSDEPRIENIIWSQAKDGSVRYQITVHNLSKEQILVTGFDVGGENQECGGHASHPLPRRLKMSAKLKVSVSRPGHNAQIRGAVTDLNDDREFATPVTGTALFRGCGFSDVHLHAPVSIRLPANDYLDIEFVIPIVKDSRSPREEQRRIRAARPSTPVEIPTMLIFEPLGALDFRLITSNKRWREIGAHYSRY